MAEEPFDAERPHDETWWERELHRNEKLMDKYMAVLGDNPDWDKWRNPEDLYNKVHFNIEPPEPSEEEKEEFEAEAEETDSQKAGSICDGEEIPVDAEDAAEESLDDPDWEDPDEDPAVNEDYEVVSQKARDFAGHVFDLEKMPGNAELLYLSAGKVGANLAGGHGLGYEDEFVCGNIVKCRWALSDCEFCREMLEQLHQNTGEAVYAGLTEESRKLAESIRERIARLRKRVWW
ncbi:MAG TPA: hypothetical protein VNT99_19195 [Methylomirabilota bacterium]|nr:hypothetical protein [Methylomirabilota bacterium]